MTENELPALPLNPLHAELRALIAASRQRLVGAVNAELTCLYWTVGQRLSSEVLGGERAAYGTQVIDQLGTRLAHEFGRGFEARNLRRMVKFAQAFPAPEIVSTLSTKLSWSHIVTRRNRPHAGIAAGQHGTREWPAKRIPVVGCAEERGASVAHRHRDSRPMRFLSSAHPTVFASPAFHHDGLVGLFSRWRNPLDVGANPCGAMPYGDCALRGLEQRLHEALLEARERLARRGVLLGGGEDE